MKQSVARHVWYVAVIIYAWPHLFSGPAHAGANMLEAGAFESDAAVERWSPADGTLQRITDNPASGEGALSASGYRGWITSHQFIPIDTDSAYELSAKVRVAPGDQESEVLVGLRFFNADKEEIMPLAVRPVENSLSSTVGDAAKGTTTLKVKNPSWGEWEDRYRNYAVVFGAKDDFSDLPNHDYAQIKDMTAKDGVYELALRKPLEKAIPTGSSVRQHRYLDYPAVRQTVKQQWQDVSLRFAGKPAAGATPEKGHYWPGAAYVRLNVFINLQANRSNADVDLPTVILDDIAFRQVDANSQKQVNAASIEKPEPIITSKTRGMVLAANGKSDYVIHHAPDAPTSVQEAAKELQRVFEAAVGVKLPIQTERPAVGTPVISLGDNTVARAAGLSGDSLAYEQFRIVTNDGNLYIAGRDTPDNQATTYSGFSRGTEYGVYTFLEQALDVRWLMPGPLGEVIPEQGVLKIGPINLTDGPDFAFRAIEVDGGPRIIGTWLRRQKLIHGSTFDPPETTALPMDYRHAWSRFMPPELLEQHPEWRAVDSKEDGKFCTRHPEALQAFIDNVLDWLDEHPSRFMVPVGPSDGQHFCRCDRCEHYVENDPHGVPSFTQNLLAFYNTVARAVAEHRPGRMISGFVYGRTSYPPAEPVELEPNVFLVWAPLNYYGLGLYKPGYFEEYERIAARWREITPNIGYLNYLHWHRSDSGAPLAPSLSLLELEASVLKEHGYRGVYQVFIKNWGYGGAANYIMGKLLWNTGADVQMLYDEWMHLAYGPGADKMKQIHRLIDSAYQEYKINQEPFRYVSGSYDVTPSKIEAIYLPILGEIETLYLQALTSVTDQAQKRRLELFGHCMVAFQHNLRKAGYLGDEDASTFHRTDEQFERFTSELRQSAETWPLVSFAWRASLEHRPEPVESLEKRTVTIPALAADRVVQIDGQIDDEEWAGAAVLDDMRMVGSRIRADPRTRARVMYDDAVLYVAVTCEEPKVDDMQAGEFPDGHMRIFTGNTVELFLDRDASDREFWHLALNPAGSRWAGVVAVPRQGFRWETAVRTASDDGQWTVELAVPFDSLGINRPVAGTTLRANLARVRQLGDEAQSSTWNAVHRRFLEPKNFGEWRFQK